jgi:hypothetical protein
MNKKHDNTTCKQKNLFENLVEYYKLTCEDVLHSEVTNGSDDDVIVLALVDVISSSRLSCLNLKRCLRL